MGPRQPQEFRAKAKKDLQRRYQSIEFEFAEVKEARRLEDGTFEVKDGDGRRWRGKKLGLATRVRDVVEEEALGYDECYAYGM